MTTIEAKHLKTLRSQVVGLLGTRVAMPVFFTTRFGIHTFFMQYPIDVVIMDQENFVIKRKENLAPNKVFMWNPIHERVLELPPHTIQKLDLEVGSQINLHLV